MHSPITRCTSRKYSVTIAPGVLCRSWVRGCISAKLHWRVHDGKQFHRIRMDSNKPFKCSAQSYNSQFNNLPRGHAHVTCGPRSLWGVFPAPRGRAHRYAPRGAFADHKKCRGPPNQGADHTIGRSNRGKCGMHFRRGVGRWYGCGRRARCARRGTPFRTYHRHVRGYQRQTRE